MNAPVIFQREGRAIEGEASASEALIRFENVRKTYTTHHGGSVAALEDVNLAIKQGSILGVIGRSGAGKSTLIRLVNGLEKPDSGQIIVDSIDISRLAEKDLRKVRRSIGMIFQHFNLLSSRTVFGNIALPLEIGGLRKSEIQDRVEHLLTLVGLTDKRNHYPAELSGGQKQRVGIARALATRPKVLLCDEATSALDPETTASILQLLASINRDLGVTILLITHEMAVIRAIAHEIAVLDAGRIVEQGDAYDLFTRPQHPTTLRFLQSETGHQLPAYLAERLRPQAFAGALAVLRVGFRGAFAHDGILSHLTRKLNCDVNILGGAIDAVADRPFGTLIIGLPAGEALANQARHFLSERGHDAEFLGYVA
ncbi:methionine ABC transporter ATP-binding protein [Beijerinckia indica]|uniref:Cell division ATP-binding protein FtsE n=1 Tax=Beijerinckia indica subsp. indica (strain ATCC 9039 / DSM 1715 / NCIMB 8712) TaxID=395963 RepID=B2IIB2_BEII9|nr:methionine ABC transporter ATP-binding protein [Beijerinckia indica]ACB96066.1 ABC transporter related [Beijerinckia indica subsp. indica ATCC 9039]